MLEVTRLCVDYGLISAVRSVSITVEPGELVALIGPNGAGKSSTLNAIAGVGGKARGSIRFSGEEILGRPPERIVRGGVALVPEGRHIFGSLSVAHNLELGLTTRRGDTKARSDLDGALDMFPILRD